MAFQDTAVCKGLPAEEGFLPSVDSLVDSKLPVIIKCFETRLAFESASDTVASHGTLALVDIAGLAVSIALCLRVIFLHWSHHLRKS